MKVGKGQSLTPTQKKPKTSQGKPALHNRVIRREAAFPYWVNKLFPSQ